MIPDGSEERLKLELLIRERRLREFSARIAYKKMQENPFGREDGNTGIAIVGEVLDSILRGEHAKDFMRLVDGYALLVEKGVDSAKRLKRELIEKYSVAGDAERCREILTEYDSKLRRLMDRSNQRGRD